MTFSLAADIRTLLSGVHRSRLNPEAVLLSYVAADYFGIVRFPTHPERACDGRRPEFPEVRSLFDRLTQEQLDSLRNRLEELYCFTQAQLKTQFPGQCSVPLYRSIGQVGGEKIGVDDPELYPLLAAAATQENKTTIELDIDIVSGWSRVAQPVYGSLTIKRDWLLEDILVVSDYLDQLGTPGPLETNEWLCINRCRSGLLTFNLDDCQLNSPPSNVPAHGEQLAKVRGLLADRTKHFRLNNLGSSPGRASWRHRLLSWVARRWK